MDESRVSIHCGSGFSLFPTTICYYGCVAVRVRRPTHTFLYYSRTGSDVKVYSSAGGIEHDVTRRTLLVTIWTMIMIVIETTRVTFTNQPCKTFCLFVRYSVRSIRRSPKFGHGLTARRVTVGTFMTQTRRHTHSLCCTFSAIIITDRSIAHFVHKKKVFHDERKKYLLNWRWD